MSLEIGDELTTPGFESKEEFIAGINNTAEAKYPCSDYNLWYYIRYNLFQNNWLSYKDETSAGHVQANAYRYFTLDVSGGDVTQYATWADEVSVCMYWECEAEDVKDEATLTIIVTVTKGDQKAVVTSYYTLNVDNFPDSDEGETINDRTDSAFNPTGNSIYLSENWRWTKVN
ncbi:MAG: hypothetical protein IJ053_04130 [Lachnospiraceae bacterium]|nr:hypothetical protein [Lachnospiraceae bacterium]